MITRRWRIRDRRSTGRKVGLAVGAGALLLAGCTASPPTDPDTDVVSRPDAVDIADLEFRLVAFDSCEHALDELKDAVAPHVSAYGLSPDVGPPVNRSDETTTDSDSNGLLRAQADAPSADAEPAAPGTSAEKGASHSGTNVHTDGVDEADVVKTDGRRLITVSGDALRVVDLERQVVTGTVELPVAATDLLFAGDRVLVIGAGWEAERSEIALLLIDIAGSPRILERVDVDGTYTDARLVDSTARIVTRSNPRLSTVHPSGDRSDRAALEANRSAVDESTIDDWLPSYRDADGQSGRLVDCGDVHHADSYSATSMVNVVSVDLEGGFDVLSAVSVLGDGQTVYATADSLYVADDRRASGAMRTEELDAGGTTVHKFDLTATGDPAYVASGAVDGWLLNQYALSEYDGHLRVATTIGEFRGAIAPGEEPDTESQVAVLAESAGELVEVGRVGGLGAGERIYSVRFIGPVGYVVTFREVDPLYTLDLRDPATPRLLGELKIPGYSAYLHPAGDHKLIGVGRDATETGQLTGAQVSLFDVADLADPRRIDMVSLDAASTEVEVDPHAFLYWEPSGLIVIPSMTPMNAPPQPMPRPGSPSPQIAPAPPTGGGAEILRLEGDSLVHAGTIEHPSVGRDPDKRFADTRIRRSVVALDALWTVSAAGVMAHELTTLDERAWIPFG
jgi:hypothetical protein